MADLGHFTRLAFSVCIHDEDDANEWRSFQFERLARIEEALIHAIRANPQLSHLDLSDSEACLEWKPHFQNIFRAIEDHVGLCIFILKDAPAFPWLEQLLSRNRRITVLDPTGNRFWNGSTIDKLYMLNRCFNGSVDLVKDSIDVRPKLVATALPEIVSNNYQCTALLLSQHTDMLCKLMEGSNREESFAFEPAPENVDISVSLSPASKKMRTA